MTHFLSPLRLAATGAITLLVLFLLCWFAALLWVASPSHIFIALFTLEPVPSWLALCQGTASALVFGALSGAVAAWIYNACAALERRA